jgi:hypothetical protein
MAGIVRGTQSRARLQHLVDGGYLTPDDADEVAELIDMVTEYVALGALSRAHADALINNLATEKAAEYRERAGLD